MSYFDPPDYTPDEEAMMEEQQRLEDVRTLIERIDAATNITDPADAYSLRELLIEASQRIHDLEQQRARFRAHVSQALDFGNLEAPHDIRF
jgi:DNA repair ATPase RecN